MEAITTRPLTRKQIKERDQIEARTLLLKYLSLGTEVYITNEHISRSGALRYVAVYVATVETRTVKTGSTKHPDPTIHYSIPTYTTLPMPVLINITGDVAILLDLPRAPRNASYYGIRRQWDCGDNLVSALAYALFQDSGALICRTL